MNDALMDSLERWSVYCVGPYVLLSAVVYSVRFLPPPRQVMPLLTPVLWLAGPPANLLVDLRDSIYPFAIGSVMVLLGLLGTVHWTRKQEPGAYICGGFVACVWVFFGLLAYSPIF